MPTYSPHKLAAFAKLTEEVETQKTWTSFSPSLLFLHQILLLWYFFTHWCQPNAETHFDESAANNQFSTSLFLLLIHDGTRDLFNMHHLACLICLIQFSSISMEFLHSIAACWRATYVYSLVFLLAYRFLTSSSYTWSFKIKLHHLFSHIICLVANAWNSSLPRCWRGTLLAQFLNSHTTSGAFFSSLTKFH